MLAAIAGSIAKARQIAGIKPLGEEFDWETVPLESLERR